MHLHLDGLSDACVVSNGADQSPNKLDARRFSTWLADARHNVGGGRGSVVSRESLLQYLLVQRQARYGDTEPLVLFLKILQPLRLIDPQTAILATPSIITLLRDTQRTTYLADRLSLRQSNLRLAKHADNMFWFVSSAHSFLHIKGSKSAEIS